MIDSNDEVLKGLFKDSPNQSTPDEIICIVDRSGSMDNILTDAEGGLNAFIRSQSELPNGANLTLVEFDTYTETIHHRKNIKDVEPYKLRPRGSTALYDAIGITLNSFPDDVAGKVIVVIVTDGQENSSKEYTQENIFKKITELKEKGWEFVFIAADQDAMAVGSSFGVDAASTISFMSSGESTAEAYAAVSGYATSLRTTSKDAAVRGLDLMKARSSTLK